MVYDIVQSRSGDYIEPLNTCIKWPQSVRHSVQSQIINYAIVDKQQSIPIFMDKNVHSTLQIACFNINLFHLRQTNLL